MEIIGSAFWFLVAVGILVTFHEFGHFIVARKMGVKVLRFSVGFGRVLWSRTDRHGTEFAIAAIPLGGYVKMLDEREGDVPSDQAQYAFNNKSLGARSAIVAAGPIFNLIFTGFAYWAMFVVGIHEFSPVLGQLDGPAAQAGFNKGERIVAIDEQPVRSWSQVMLELVPRSYQQDSVSVTVERDDGGRAVRRLPLQTADGEALDETRILEQLGLQPWHRNPDVIVQSVVADSPAERAGLAAKDRIIAVNDVATPTVLEFQKILQEQAKANDGAVQLSVLRGGSERSIAIKARSVQTDNGESLWQIGMYFELYTELQRYGVLESVGKSLHESWRVTSGSLTMLYHMLAGNASLKNLSGPITIAQVANASASSGLSDFLNFLALISLSLAIVNLLPIPVLDGGHLLYYFIEWVKGSPLSEQAQTVGLFIGLAMIIGMMGLAFYNDIARQLS